jgi:cytochrome oxidase assembly protein ShyY1
MSAFLQVYCPIEGSIPSSKIEGLLKVPVSRKVSNQIESYSSYCEQNFDFPFEAEVIRLPIIKRPFIIKHNERDKDAIRVNQLSDQDSYSYLLSLDIDLFSQDLLLSQRHWGYMLQWSFLSLLSLGFSIYFLLRKKINKFSNKKKN